MKFLSNFDTNMDKDFYERYASKFSKDKIMLVYRDKMFLFFNIIIPSIFYIGVWIGILVVAFIIEGDDKNLNHLLWWIVGIMFLLSFFWYGWKILKSTIDYNMDFTIITPEDIISVNQTGLFQRESRTLDTHKLKTISVSKKGILNSVFNYGSIMFLSEGETSGEIEIDYVSDPDEIKHKLEDIIDTRGKGNYPDLKAGKAESGPVAPSND